MNQNQMRRLQELKEGILDQYEKIHYLPLKKEAINHTLGVESWMEILCQKRKLPCLAARAAALLHDCARFLDNASPKDHAKAGAIRARKILEEASWPEEEIELITRAIRHHSDKGYEDDPLDEALKDADTLARFMDNPLEEISPKRLKRLDELFKELDF